MSFIPTPERVWSRVQHPCTYKSLTDNEYVYDPLKRQTISKLEADYQKLLFNKGNILQYKSNSANMTKNQKYAQFAKGGGPNRTKTFATQGISYSNPNTNNFLRVNFTTVSSQNVSGSFQYDVPNPSGCSTNTIMNGGNLVGGNYVNPCTNEVIKLKQMSSEECYLTSFSDVPGKQQLLCWNKRINPWIPKSIYKMNTSGTKFPQNYKSLTSAMKPAPPTLSLISFSKNIISLQWEILTKNCLPISNYNIYQNNVLIRSVPPNITSFSEQLPIIGVYSFYVTSVSDNKIESDPSNEIIVK